MSTGNHDGTRERFERHRRAFESNEALRILYADWYGRVRGLLPAPEIGPGFEIGAGPGLSRSFIPDMHLTDVVPAPWLDLAVAGETLPFRDASLGALVLFDVLHHLPSPTRFFTEAVRVLRRGGRVVLCEPYVSPASYPVYRFLHEEGLDFTADPLTQDLDPGKDPFAGNQAVPTALFERGAQAFAARFPELRRIHFERAAGLSYPASGGFGRAPLLPMAIWRLLHAAESALPEFAFRLIGFRLIAAVERV